MAREAVKPEILEALEALAAGHLRWQAITVDQGEAVKERLALVDAAAAVGASKQAIASTLGISRQRVAEILERSKP